MPQWFQNIISLLFTKKKIMAWIAALVIAILAAVFGISTADIKEAVQNAPIIELPTASTTTMVGNGK